jgi:GNAT superfamily N-acetyltransferase
MEDNVTIVRTTSDNLDFRSLIAQLDKGLWERYTEAGPDYWGNNIIEFNPHVVLIYQDEIAVGCGCFKEKDESTVELKRMFVQESARGLGFAKLLITQLEGWARELNYSVIVLETLYKQEEAISLYKKVGYVITDNYPPYVGYADSICMRKGI